MTVMNKVRSIFGRSKKAVAAVRGSESTGILYSVSIPGEESVMVRASNQIEARSFVRSARGLKRLPDGTKVSRA